MHARLHLKSGDTVVIEDLKVIKKKKDRDAHVEEINDFTNFFFSASCYYSFIGKNVVSLYGDDLLWVEFVN